jgi:hypothetical protein
MADPVAPDVKTSKLSLTNHAPVSAGLFAGSLVTLLLGVAKSKWQIDLSGYEPQLIVVVSGIVGYLTGAA